jgi:Putative beta-barrel porin-2, OmpL-like. bbp2
VQIFPTNKLKIEPWLINGWQSYGKFNGRMGVGAQILWRPTEKFSLVSNNYAFGQDTVGLHRTRWHTDNSVQYKYYENPKKLMNRSAFSFTWDLGCERGAGVSCVGSKDAPAQNFVGFMFYNRWWFHKDLFGVTLGGGAMENPGRYLVLLPPINGATAASGTPYFSANPGDNFKAWDAQATFDFMPSQWVTWRFEFTHRAANVPYFTGAGGLTPPGGNNGAPSVYIPGWSPDLRKRENRFIIALLVKL